MELRPRNDRGRIIVRTKLVGPVAEATARTGSGPDSNQASPGRATIVFLLHRHAQLPLQQTPGARTRVGVRVGDTSRRKVNAIAAHQELLRGLQGQRVRGLRPWMYAVLSWLAAGSAWHQIPSPKPGLVRRRPCDAGTGPQPGAVLTVCAAVTGRPGDVDLSLTT